MKSSQEDGFEELPEGIQNANPLSVAEALLVLEISKSARSSQSMKDVEKTENFLRRISKFLTKPKVIEVRQKLEQFPFRDWEKILLCDMTPKDGREAKSLIPSLRNYEDQEIERAVDALNDELDQ